MIMGMRARSARSVATPAAPPPPPPSAGTRTRPRRAQGSRQYKDRAGGYSCVRRLCVSAVICHRRGHDHPPPLAPPAIRRHQATGARGTARLPEPRGAGGNHLCAVCSSRSVLPSVGRSGNENVFRRHRLQERRTRTQPRSRPSIHPSEACRGAVNAGAA